MYTFDTYQTNPENYNYNEDFKECVDGYRNTGCNQQLGIRCAKQ